MKKFLVCLSVALVSTLSFAQDASRIGTITINGVFAPKLFSFDIALNDCGAGTTLVDCETDLDTAVFAGHTENAVINIGNIADGEDNVRHIQFEMKARLLAFRNDYIQLIMAQTASTNDIDVSLRRLTWVSGGLSTFGQTTLGEPGVLDLAANEAMLDGIDYILTVLPTTVYDQTVDAPGVVNEFVLNAAGAPRAVTLRGVLTVTFGDQATSSAYSSTIQTTFIVKDN